MSEERYSGRTIVRVRSAPPHPAYHPATLLKVYVYGYFNKVQSRRRLEREAQRNVELMWLTGRLVPDHKTIADFRRENGAAIQAACAQFVVVCRQLGLFGAALVAIDGSKFKAVNTRDLPLFQWTPNPAFRSWRGVPDENCGAPGFPGSVQAGGGGPRGRP